MANYKHGVYSELEKSGLTSSSEALGTVPVYIGTLPVQRANVNGAADFDYSGYINKPLLISSYRDVQRLNLYSENWDVYTLCEAIHAHFLNDDEVIAPILLVNVLEPKDLSTETTTEGTAKVGYIEDALASLDGMAITIDNAELAEGEFSYAYADDSVKITITKEITATSATVTYKQIAFTKDKVTADKMQTALTSLDMSEFLTGYIPNIIAAPYFSSVPELHAKMIQYAINRIADKWYTIVVSDIPCGAEVKTRDLAKAWKNTNGYNNKLDKPCWPKVQFGKKKYHLSTLACYTMQVEDMENDGVPAVSPSNKYLNADTVILDDGTMFFMKESEANELNAVGITTVNLNKRMLKLWGPHMANYNHEKKESIQLEDLSDSGIRTTLYLANMLQHDYIDEIDQPFVRTDIDSVKNSAQQKLNSLVNAGYLLYADVQFNEASNSEDDLANGNFIFDVEYTHGPNAKAITFKLRYTNKGLSLLTAGGDE